MLLFVKTLPRVGGSLWLFCFYAIATVLLLGSKVDVSVGYIRGIAVVMG